MEPKIRCATCLDRMTDPWDYPCIRCRKKSEWRSICPPQITADQTSPTHYTRWKIQPIDFITANNIDFIRGNIIKYILRYDAKNGLEDLKKAGAYLEKLIAKVQQENDHV